MTFVLICVSFPSFARLLIIGDFCGGAQHHPDSSSLEAAEASGALKDLAALVGPGRCR